MLFNKVQGNLLLYIYCNIDVYIYKVYALNHIYCIEFITCILYVYMKGSYTNNAHH